MLTRARQVRPPSSFAAAISEDAAVARNSHLTGGLSRTATAPRPLAGTLVERPRAAVFGRHCESHPRPATQEQAAHELQDAQRTLARRSHRNTQCQADEQHAKGQVGASHGAQSAGASPAQRFGQQNRLHNQRAGQREAQAEAGQDGRREFGQRADAF